MSRDAHREPDRSDRSAVQRDRRFSLRRSARKHRLPIAALWIAVCVWIGWRLVQGPQVRGDLDLLLPSEHRAPHDDVLVMLIGEHDPDGATSAAHDELLAAAERVHERVDAWTPIAPPVAEIQGWLDQHALSLLPESAHAQLQQRLTNAAIESAVDGLHARLSSPFFGVTRDDARRDPLQLRMLTEEAAGRFGHVVAGTPEGAEVTARGDLISAKGDAVLMLLRDDTPLSHVLEQVSEAVGESPVRVAAVGPARQEVEAENLVRARWPRLLGAALAAITVVLALALRRVRPALAMVAAVATVGTGLLVALPALDPSSLPLIVLACGMAFEGAPHVQRISARGWAAAAILSTALLPLLWTPYPLWKQWAWWWAVAMLAAFALGRVVAPAMMGMLDRSGSVQRRGFVLQPSPVLASLATVFTLGFGIFSADEVTYRGPDSVELGETIDPPEQRRLLESFFDPSLVVWTSTPGDDETDALVRGAPIAQQLSSLVPEHASRIDTPAALVLPTAELERRRAALARLDLRSRLRELENVLQARGFRPAAFGEFLRGASDTRAMPTAETLLQGPLGRWTQRYLQSHDDGSILRSYVHLRPEPDAALPVLADVEGNVVELRGPQAAARIDRARFADWLLVAVLGQLWLGGLWAWLGTRSLAVAFSAMVCAVVAQTAVLAALVGLGQPLSPVVLPAFLLVAAATIIASSRACRAIDAGTPLFAMGLLSTSACQIAAGLTLIASGVPAWSQVGWVTAIGCAVASGAGLFVAPGVTAALRKLAPRAAAPRRSNVEHDEGDP